MSMEYSIKLSFPLVGSLNGVHMFAKSHGIQLVSTYTSNAKVLWKEFHNSIVLIAISGKDEDSDIHLNNLINLVFNAMVLVIGEDSLIRFKNVEKLKRDLRCCYKLIDALLQQHISPDPTHHHCGDMMQATDCILCLDNSALQVWDFIPVVTFLTHCGFKNCLDSFVDGAFSTYGCLLVGGRVVVATKKWWSLTGLESMLLIAFLNSCPASTCRDVPVFLPVSSPTVPHRLLTFQLTQGTEVCVLCGTTPSLAQLQKDVIKHWKQTYELLRSSSQYLPRGFPTQWQLDKNLLAFLLVNYIEHRCLCFVKPQEASKASSSSSGPSDWFKRIRAFYKSVAGTIFPVASSTTEVSESDLSYENTKFLTHHTTETYMCADSFKCYAIKNDVYQLFVLYSESLPNFALRSVTSKTLNLLTKTKHVHL